MLSRAEETRKMPRELLEEDSQSVYATCVQSRENRLNNELRKRGAGAPGLTKSEEDEVLQGLDRDEKRKKSLRTRSWVLVSSLSRN